MPEGPEVRIISEELHELLKDKVLKEITIHDEDSFSCDGIDIPMTITKVYPKGKKIIIETDTDYTICCKLGMTGRWGLESQRNDKFIRVEFNFENNFTIYYIDQSKYGKVEIIENDNIDSYLENVGPDLLNQQELITRKLWYKTIMGTKKYQNWQICKYLLSQEIFSGIGNYLKSDILWVAKIKPDRLIKDLNENEIENIRKAALYVIKESYDAGGLTFSHYYPPSNKKGEYITKIYDRTLDIKGNSVIFDKFKDGRKSFWAPKLQT
jgi:endonuclease-8